MTRNNQLPRFAFVFLITCSFITSAQQKKILIVSTNVDSVGVNASGTFLMEIAYPLKHFTDQGFDVDVVTPKGGPAAIYQRAKEPDDLIFIRESEVFMATTRNTLAPSQVNAADYVAIFYPGGHGQYFDVVDNQSISKITAIIYEKGGVVGTAGHGAASLVNVRLADGSYLVAGKSITCFPSWAEKKFMNISEYGKLLAFDMQEVLTQRGAKLTVSAEQTYRTNELERVVDKDNRIVTGAFAGSAGWVAEEMVKLLSTESRSPARR
jgi:putative intracellular protease/amidase